MKIPRPQEFAVAALFIIAAIGPALAGLCCHLAWVGVTAALQAAWRAVS
jgi:hypothetical protein